MEHKHTNRLIHESSPYLLQHAHNPVDWYPWGPEALQKAKDENKLLIISIGYSACHWCHVMERESFEDETVAKWMNGHYICIKVDREERPDVDALYMDAATLMHGHGGWPLNAFALPDGRPVYAGTYFPKDRWLGLLHEIAGGYKKKPDQYIEYAEKLLNGIKGLSIIETPEEDSTFSVDDLKTAYLFMAQQFDHTHGGKGRAPKFPMPDIYFFLLRYDHAIKDVHALNHVHLTLEKMAKGGIYDQIGGGFARYSTDAKWLVPHFEKMLYDNAQLISLYSEAYSTGKKQLYKDVVYQTIEFAQRELMSPEFGFYCALDADSEGVEGKYYIWQEDEFINTVGNENAELLKKYFGIGNEGYWEEDNNILVQATEVPRLALEFNKPEAEINSIIEDAKTKLLKEREERIRPGLDDKILLSWNCLMINGLLKAYEVFEDENFLASAEKTLAFISENLVIEKQLFHSYKNGKAAIPAFLDDYAQFISALIQHYETTFNKNSLKFAKELTEHVLDHFIDEKSGLFYFTSEENNELATRKIDTSDNVIASPNSVMAHNLFRLGLLFSNENHIRHAEKMLAAVMPQVLQFAPFYSNWSRLLINFTSPFYEVAIAGNDALKQKHFLERVYMPNKVICGTEETDEELPLLQNRFIEGKSLIYVCQNKACQLPVETAEEALDLMRK